MFKNISIDKSLCLIMITGIVLAGGKPISPIAYKALESYYDIQLPTYNISELMNIIDSGNKQLEFDKKSSQVKIDINSYQKLLDTLKTKGIAYKQIAGYRKGVAQLKVEGAKNVHNVKVMLSSIKTSDSIRIEIKYLNDQELVITMLKGV